MECWSSYSEVICLSLNRCSRHYVLEINSRIMCQRLILSHRSLWVSFLPSFLLIVFFETSEIVHVDDPNNTIPKINY